MSTAIKSAGSKDSSERMKTSRRERDQSVRDISRERTRWSDKSNSDEVGFVTLDGLEEAGARWATESDPEEPPDWPTAAAPSTCEDEGAIPEIGLLESGTSAAAPGGDAEVDGGTPKRREGAKELMVEEMRSGTSK